MNSSVVIIPQRAEVPGRRIRVAVYCRVSNKHEELESSFENQVSHYRDSIGNDPEMELIEIYCDFGISGYKESRPGFQRMMEDAKSHRFELIVTKSVSRFARNTCTVLKATRRLAELGIGVFFELQNINTLSKEGELLMTMYAAFGQAERDGAREHTLMSLRRRIENGNPPRQLQRCLGYSKNQLGEFVPDKDAALVVEMFEMAADGCRVSEITKYLNENGFRTKKGNCFDRTGVTRILQNAAYKGDFICQRFFVDDSGRLVKNKGERQMFYFENDHVPIVSRELWDRAQEALDSHARGNKSGKEHEPALYADTAGKEHEPVLYADTVGKEHEPALYVDTAGKEHESALCVSILEKSYRSELCAENSGNIYGQMPGSDSSCEERKVLSGSNTNKPNR